MQFTDGAALSLTRNWRLSWSAFRTILLATIFSPSDHGIFARKCLQRSVNLGRIQMPDSSKRPMPWAGSKLPL